MVLGVYKFADGAIQSGLYTNGELTTTGASVAPQVTIPSTSDVVESRIDGTFEGWSGGTIFKLMNGQIWQQTGNAYTYHYAYMPKVLIYKSGLVYKLRVDGVSTEITVNRVK